MLYKSRKSKQILFSLALILSFFLAINSGCCQDLVISSYLGGIASDKGYGIAVDSLGNLFVSGMTSSPDFPVQNPFDSTFNGLWDVFISKVNSSGDWLEYSTFLGGLDGAQSYDIAVDNQGCAYITGKTNSSEYPTAGPYESSYAGGGDAFITKLAPDGNSLIYSMFLGGSGEDWGEAVHVDGAGNACIIGATSSPDFPLANALDSSYNGGSDIFVTIISAAGDAVLFSTYLGGTSDDYGNDITVSGDGRIYLVGRTRSADFPQVNPGFAYAGAFDAFVTRISSPPRVIQFSTFFGGTGNDEARCLAVNDDNKLIITGWTDSGNFPVVNALDSTHNGLEDIFMAVFNLAADSLEFSTYYGGSGRDEAFGLCLDNSGNIIMAGETGSGDFPLTAPLDSTLAGESDGFICRFAYPQLTPDFSTYYGGSSSDAVYDVAADQYGSIYACGVTTSPDLPMSTPLDSTFGGVADAFYGKFASGNKISREENNPEPNIYLGCYPNPFNAQTTIEYVLPVPAEVRLSIYDIRGRLVSTLVNCAQPAGPQRINWSVNNTPSGIYFYRLSADNYFRTGKMILLK